MDVCGDGEASRAFARNAVIAIAVSAATATAIATASGLPGFFASQ